MKRKDRIGVMTETLDHNALGDTVKCTIILVLNTFHIPINAVLLNNTLRRKVLGCRDFSHFTCFLDFLKPNLKFTKVFHNETLKKRLKLKKNLISSVCGPKAIPTLFVNKY